MNVYENIAFGLEMRRVAKAERRVRVEEALNLVKLSGMGTRYADQLSGGQQQRVALARVLVIRPTVLLLDEPLGALDRQLREEMQVEIRQLQQRVGITTIFVTHDQDEALTMSDRIAVVNRGVVEQIGTPGEIYERPRTEFVANFIGVSNTFEGTVMESARGASLVQTADGTIGALGDSAPGRRVRVVVRPDKMRLADSLDPPLNGVKGRIQEVIYLGTHSRYFVTLPGGKRVMVYEQNLSGPRQRPRRAGEEIHVAWHQDDALILSGGRPPAGGVR